MSIIKTSHMPLRGPEVGSPGSSLEEYRLSPQKRLKIIEFGSKKSVSEFHNVSDF